MILRHLISLRAGWRAGFQGGSAWWRRFGRTPDMPPGERLVIVVEPASSAAGAATVTAVTLNGRPLDELPRAESLRSGAAVSPRIARDVTADLEPRNDLVIVPAPGTGPTATTGDGHLPLPETVARVWLEVHAPCGDGGHAGDHS